jgi:hypothetical protein
MKGEFPTAAVNFLDTVVLYCTDLCVFFVSLNWFKSIQSKYAADEEDLIEKKNAQEVKRKAKIAASKQGSWFSSGVEDNTQEDDDEMTILNLMGKRLEGHRREMAMLFFSLHGAETFFKTVRSK